MIKIANELLDVYIISIIKIVKVFITIDVLKSVYVWISIRGLCPRPRKPCKGL